MNREAEFDRIRMAARRGAASATFGRQVLADAADHTIERWEIKLLSGAKVDNPEAWAFRTAANAARRIGSKSQAHRSLADLSEREPNPRPKVPNELLLATLKSLSRRLTDRQQTVVRLLAQPSMTIHEAARQLRTDRSNVRKIFRRALKKLASDRPPPPADQRAIGRMSLSHAE